MARELESEQAQKDETGSVEELRLDLGRPIEDEEYDDGPLNPAVNPGPGGDGEPYVEAPSEIDSSREPESDNESGYPSMGFGFAVGEEEEPDDVLEFAPGELAAVLARGSGEQEDLEELQWCLKYERATRRQQARRFRGLPAHVDPNDLAQTGWGIIFAKGESLVVRRYLEPLIEKRKQQAKGRFFDKVYTSPEKAASFLWYRLGVAPGVLDLNKAPFYWLIVGSPEAIPFEFQYQLQVSHAVGRVCFDNPEDYRRYAESVLAAEAKGCGLAREAVFFSVRNDDDPTTEILSEQMVEPVARHMASSPEGWGIKVLRGEQTSKADLARLFGGDGAPGIVLVSAHGKGLGLGDPKQMEFQGAPLCKEWPGPRKVRGLHLEHIFHAGDVPEPANLQGQISFLFSCYGAGTPEYDNFPDVAKDRVADGSIKPKKLTEKPFVARLPQELLKRGALAVVGHIDRGWTLSFAWKVNDQSVATLAGLKDALDQVLAGRRLGAAMRSLHQRYTALAAYLTEPLESARLGKKQSDDFLAFLWLAHNDARNFIILGDPAVQALGGNRQPVARRMPVGRGSGGVDGPRGLPVFLRADVLERAYLRADSERLGVAQWVNQVVDAELRRVQRSLFLKDVIRTWSQQLAVARGFGNQELELDALNTLGRAYRAYGAPAQARAHHEEQLQLARNYENSKEQLRALGNLGLAWRDLGGNTEARDLWQELLSLARERGDSTAEGRALGNLANVHRDLGDVPLAIQMLEQRIAFAEAHDDELGIAMGNWNLGETYEQQGNLALAIEKMQVRVDYEAENDVPGAAERAAHVEALRQQLGG